MTRMKNVAAAIGLLTAIVAIPALLWAMAGNPVPAHLSIQALVDAFTTRDDGSNLLHIIVWVGWLAWLYFAVAVVLEAMSQLRQARTGQPLHVPGFGGARGLVAPLVSVALGLSISLGSTGAAMATTPTPAPIAASATARPAAAPVAADDTAPAPAADQQTASATSSTTSKQSAQTQYTVTHDGEALWSIAEHFYGEGTQWTTIAKANPKVTGPEGRRLLQAGDVLLIPNLAPATVTSPSHAATSGYVAHTVASTDALRGLAEHYLGAAERWTEIFNASKAITQPDGQHLSDPDVIVDGWTLHIPTPAPAIQASAPVTAAPSAATATSGYVTHTVASTDTLRGLAEHYLGAAERWTEIFNASKAITQPDGQHLSDPDVIVDGWTLHIPTRTTATASSAPTAAAPAAHGPQMHTAPTAAPKPVPATAAAEKPPVTAPAAPTTPATQTTTHPATAPTLAGDDTVAPITTAPTARPHAAAASQPAADPAVPAGGIVTPGSPQWATQRPATTTAPEQTQPQLQTSAAPSPAADVAPQESSTALPRGIEAIGGILAVCLLGILGKRWRQQAARRRPGQRMPALPEAEATVIGALHTTEGPLTSVHLDQALRSLSAALADQERLLPPLLAARLDDDRIDLILAEDTEQPPAPFTGTAPRVWSYLPANNPLPHTSTAAPYPALVTLGRDDDDAHLLVDLETLGALAITDPRPVEIIAALATELSTSTWADDLSVTLVGACQELPAALGVDRLTWVPDMDHLIDLLERQASTTRDALTDDGLDSARQGRTSTETDQWTPHVVLVATPIDDATAERLGRILTDQPRVSIAAVTTDAHKLSSWTLTTTGTTAVLDPLNLTLTPQRLTSDTYAAICQVSTHSLSTTTEPAPWWNHDSDAQRPDEDDDIYTADDTVELPVTEPVEQPSPVVPLHQPTIRLLGEVRIDNIPAALTKARSSNEVFEPIVYVHLHPGAPTTGLQQALATHIDNTDPVVSRARRYLGTTDTGERLFPLAARTQGARTYTLHESVTSDWNELNQLITGGVNTAPTRNLWRALDLVNGRPLDTVTPGQWPWIEDTRSDMINTILDISHEVAERAIAKGDPTRAAWAIRKGHLVDPLSELIARDELRLHLMTGNATALQHVIDQIMTTCRDLGIDPDEETTALIHSISDTSRHRARA